MAMKNAQLGIKKSMIKSVKISKTLKGRLNFNKIIEGSVPLVLIDTTGHALHYWYLSIGKKF
jgi:hypothetical protein